MIAEDMRALSALSQVRAKRPVQLNPGFLRQVSDLDFKLEFLRRKKDEVLSNASTTFDKKQAALPDK
jgi:hypothetical protein